MDTDHYFHLNSVPNSVEFGFQFEKLLAAHLSIKCALRSDLTNFKLVVNAEGYEKLDDLVIQLFDENGLKEVLLCQLKYKSKKDESDSTLTDQNENNSNKILNDQSNRKRKNDEHDSKETLAGQSNNKKRKVENSKDLVKEFLNLKKYEESYNKLAEKYGPNVKITVVLFTNSIKTHPKELTAIPITFLTKNVLSIFNTNQEMGNCYQLINDKEDSRFYENCYLFCDQIGVKQANDLISNDLDGCFSTEQIRLIHSYFQEVIPKRKDPFDKFEINLMLRDILMNSFVITPDSLPDENINKSNSHRLINTFNTFNLSKITEQNSRHLINSIIDFIENKLNVKLDKLQWDSEISEEIIKKLLQIDLYKKCTELKKAYKPLTKKDLWFLFWAIGESPLLLKTNQSNHKQIEFILKHLSSNVSIVLCDEHNFIPNAIGDLKVFNSLFDLKETNNNLLLEILEQTKICLYFNSTSLKEIVNKDDDLLKCVTPESFIKLLSEDINITTIYERLPFYIERLLQTKLYNKDVAQSKGFISIVDSDSSLPNLEEYCPGVTETTFYSKYTAEVTTKLISDKVTDKKFCYFRTLADKFYCYSTNLENLDGIKHYLTDAMMNETDLLNYQNGCKIIYGPAGIGKTTLLQNLAVKSTPENLCIYIHINDLLRNSANETSFESKEALADYLSDIFNQSKDNHLKSFVRTFMLKCLEQNRIQLLFDGFDETNANPEIFERLLNKLGTPFILCTRSSKIAGIETVLTTLSMFELMEFNQENQEEFIREKCENPVNRQEIIDKVVKKLSETPTLNIFGIPFLVKLLTEIYEEIKTDVKEWTIINILETFVEKQMKKYDRRQIERTVRNLACSVFFENHLLEQLKINTRHLDEDVEDFRLCNRNDTIISNVNVAKEIQFTHRVYAEFLCAQYLCDLFSNAPPKELKNYSEIYELLFAEDLIQIRYFFDLLMCRDLPLHTAILLNDEQKVQYIINNDEDSIGNCDKLGRTCLHVLMGYGVRYNYPYKVGGLKNIRKLKTYNLYKEDRQFSISTDLIEHLFEFDINIFQKTKDLFGNLPYIYGFYSRSYSLLNYYRMKFVGLDSIPDINQTVFFIYFIVSHNFNSLFDTCVKLFQHIKWEIGATERSSIINFFNKYDTIFEHFNMNMIKQLILNENYTILHLASAENLPDTVESILFYNLIPINCVDYNQNTALDYAIFSNHQRIIKLLKAKGGTTHNSSNNNCTTRGSSPMCKANMDSDLQTLKLLIEDGADLNLRYDGDSILEIAAGNATTEMLQFLIQTLGKANIDVFKLLCYSLENSKVANANYLISYEMDFKNTFICHNYRKINMMHLAAKKGDSKTIESLLKKGCSVDVTDYACNNFSENKTPIFYSIESNNIETLNYLIKQGANLNHKLNKHYGIMHYAAEFGNSETISILRDAGGNTEELNSKNETPFYSSIRVHNIETFTFLISCGANLNHKANNNYGVMHCAAQYGNSKIISILKDEGGHIEDLDLDKETPIYYSIRVNNINTLKFLINCKANLNHKANNNYSVMHCAAQYGKSETISILKDAGGNIEDFDLNQKTPIYFSIRVNNVETLKFLISCGANLNHKLNNNYGVMHCAAEYGNSEIISILKDTGENIEDLHSNQETPIYFSIRRRNTETLKSLISFGANLNHKPNNNRGVMHCAARYGSSEIISILKDTGGNIEDLYSMKETIYFSIQHRNTETLKSLISFGANLNHKANNNYGVMHCAAEHGNSEIISILKDAGENIEDFDLNQETPIYFSIRGNNVETLEFLISCGVNLKHKASNNRGIIHKAAATILDGTDVLDVLIENSCDIEELDDSGRTAIFYAIENKNYKVIKYLIKKGANLNHKSKDGSVLRFAEKIGDPKIIDTIKEHGALKDDKRHRIFIHHPLFTN